jgi:hypothetical protein
MNTEQARKKLGISARSLQRIVKRLGLQDKVTYQRGKSGKQEAVYTPELVALVKEDLMRPTVRESKPDAVKEEFPEQGQDLQLSRQSGQVAALFQMMVDAQSHVDDRFLTRHEASEQFGLSLTIINRAVKDEKLRLYPVGRHGAHVLRLSEVRAFVRSL